MDKPAFDRRRAIRETVEFMKYRLSHLDWIDLSVLSESDVELALERARVVEREVSGFSKEMKETVRRRKEKAMEVENG